MAPLIYLDTHVVAWLYAGRVELLPDAARQRIEESDLLISPMVSLELQYLFEIGRTAEPAGPVLEALSGEIGLRVCSLSFTRVVSEALANAWTRDPFDRMIVAQAEAREAALVTADETIHANYSRAAWNG